MTVFLRLLSDRNKANNLLASCAALRSNAEDGRRFYVAGESFRVVPGAPFAYWVSNGVREQFLQHPPFLSEDRWPSIGASTKDDFRYVRSTWEILRSSLCNTRGASLHLKWVAFAKGGSFSSFYAAIYLCVNWLEDGKELKSDIAEYRGSRGWGYQWSAALNGHDYYFRPGLTWPRRTQKFGVRVMPTGCIFADKGPAAFAVDDNPVTLLALLALMNSRPFSILVELSLNAGDRTARSFEIGIIQKIPVPDLKQNQQSELAKLAHRAWALKRTLDTVEETSHAFLLPAALRTRLGEYDLPTIEAELARIHSEIDEIGFELYGFAEADRQVAPDQNGGKQAADDIEEDDEIESIEPEAPPIDALLAWAVGVAFGRFDWRLATGERQSPPEPDPFDPLPAKSPAMLPDGAEPFQVHVGILVDEQGHSHDLARLVEEVLTRVDVPVPDNMRRWLQRDFFTFHLQRYSKSRRKAPIYWPLTTTSGSYTLWVYYPTLTSQTLYTAINDFVEPKLKQVGDEVAALRNKGAARSRDDEKQFETLQGFDLDLIELRDTLLNIAQGYQPNHDDGVQITAAPLWPLFRHKPWQKILKDTWAKLEKGDYDWAHLAMSYWPARVQEKCKTDKSLAIAHDLEDLYVEPVAKPMKTRGKKNAGAIE